jgi:hypothetical protein
VKFFVGWDVTPITGFLFRSESQPVLAKMPIDYSK